MNKQLLRLSVASMVLLGASLLLIYADVVKPVNLGG